MADNEKKKAVITRSKKSHEQQMDIIKNLLRENHQLKQVCIEIYRGLSDPTNNAKLFSMYLERIESLLAGQYPYEG